MAQALIECKSEEEIKDRVLLPYELETFKGRVRELLEKALEQSSARFKGVEELLESIREYRLILWVRLKRGDISDMLLVETLEGEEERYCNIPFCAGEDARAIQELTEKMERVHRKVDGVRRFEMLVRPGFVGTAKELGYKEKARFLVKRI